MGNSPSNEESSDITNIVANYEYDRKFNDSRFGEIKLLKHKHEGPNVF